MRVRVIARGGMLAALGLLVACGGGGGSGGAAPTPSPSPPPPPPQKSLFIATQPVGALQAAAFATQPVVHVRSNGTTDAADNSTVVTAALVAGTGATGAQLTGTTTATASAGVATFTNLGISLAGSNYQLRFTATGVTEATSSAFAIDAPPTTPAVTFSIDSSRDVHPISRFIYGMNGWDPAGRPKNLTLSRSGGNRMTAYNWENNACNAGSDYQNQNDDFLGGGNTPNGAVAPGLEAARAAGAATIVTMPLIGYVAADKNGGGDVAGTAANPAPNYLATRFKQSKPRKGGAFAVTPDTTDPFVYQDEYVHFLDDRYPGAFGAANNPIWISLDNEPDLWQHTHARLRGDSTTFDTSQQHGTTATYAEMVQRTTDYADAAKDVNPAALVFGPVNYGWQGMIRFQDAADAGNRDFLEFYLAQMKSAETATGHRLVDVLDVHWYPEARGTCIGNPMDGCRITEEATDAAVVAARKQAPRSLWDGTYTENSWIAQFSTNGPIRLLPRLEDKIAAHYPGTRLAITEYNYGAANHISGAIAQADALGVFGREGLYAATLWRLVSNNNFIYGAFEMFRNFDGASGSFGDTSIRASTSDVANATVYASVDDGNPDRMVIVCINKADSDTTAAFAITHAVQFHTAGVYQLTAASPQGQPQARADVAVANSGFQYTLPANSVVTLVLRP
ncbi:MAG TPA: glycoside hydrolase family 44 protein [Steroidobacteraceae bacterium]